MNKALCIVNIWIHNNLQMSLFDMNHIEMPVCMP